MHKEVVRILSLSKYNSHTEHLKIINIFKLQQLNFHIKYNTNMLPHYLQSLLFHHITETHDHGTYYRLNIHEAKTKQSCFCYTLCTF